MTEYMRTCAAGSTMWLTNSNSTSFGGKFFCPLHIWSLLHEFDPRPYGKGGTDDTVKLIDGSEPAGFMHAERYERTYAVLRREGETLTLRQVGLPNSEEILVSVFQVYPADSRAVYRHASKCSSRVPKS